MFTVCLAREPIGFSPLDCADLSMGVVVGPFTPAPGYEQVRPLFRRFAEFEAGDEAQLRRFYEERNALDLRLLDPEGRQIGTAAIHVYDYSVDSGSEAYQLEVHLADASTWPQATAGGEPGA